MNKEEIIEIFKPYCKTIYLTGSSTLPFIKNTHDIDIILIANEGNESKVRELCDEYYSTHSDKVSFLRSYHKEYFWINEVKFYETLYGDDLVFTKCATLKEYKAKLKEYVINRILKEPVHGNIELIKRSKKKQWYHIYLAKHLARKNTLTEEETENVNILHDVDENNEKYSAIISELKKWLNL